MKEFNLFGNDMFGHTILDPDKKVLKGQLHTDFIYPPFTILNSKDGPWQQRKLAWKELGIESELGREGVECMGDLSRYRPNSNAMPVVSIFDPVITELSYRWFCPPGGQIVDPFAGGSVRGLVAGILGFKYHGIDLSEKQVIENQKQKELLASDADVNWVVGDTTEKIVDAPEADFIFSCPPYGNLERYSDDPKDLSTMSYADFIDAYTKVIAGCMKKLKNNSFACFVVGDYRDKKTGNYVGFVADTIKAFQAQDVGFYNDAVLATAIGTAPIRTPKPFKVSRKMTKIHQNILVFLKGELPSWKGTGVI